MGRKGKYRTKEERKKAQRKWALDYYYRNKKKLNKKRMEKYYANKSKNNRGMSKSN